MQEKPKRVTNEEFNEWKRHPVTIALRYLMDKWVEDLKTDWFNNKNPSIEQAQAYKDVSQLDYQTLKEEIWDDK